MPPRPFAARQSASADSYTPLRVSETDTLQREILQTKSYRRNPKGEFQGEEKTDEVRVSGKDDGRYDDFEWECFAMPIQG